MRPVGRRGRQAGRLTVVALLVLSVPVAVQEKGGQDETGPYTVVENWLEAARPGWYHHVTGVFAESPDRIYVTASGETPIEPALTSGGRRAPIPAGFDPTRPGAQSAHFLVVANRDGRIIERWTHLQSVLVRPHSVQMNPYDPEKHVWIIDREGQQILKLTNDGQRIVMTLGEKGVSGADRTHFNRPADVAFLPDGSFLVADGYINTRVVKFDARGQYLMEWGSAGAGPGQFNLVHAVAVDAEGRVYVADRGNGRVQVFTAEGTHLDTWRSRRPQHLIVTRDRHVWVSDGQTNRFLQYDLQGRLISYFGTHGTFPGAMDNPHKFSVDSSGNLYIVDYNNNRLQKFMPRSDADPRRLVGQPLG